MRMPYINSTLPAPLAVFARLHGVSPASDPLRAEAELRAAKACGFEARAYTTSCAR
jgi:hypothetical protein